MKRQYQKLKATDSVQLSCVTEMNSKKILRADFSRIRAGITDKSAKDFLIAKRVMEDSRIMKADCILLYASFRSEIDTWQLTGLLLEKNITIAFPKCHENGIMTFHIVKNVNELHAGAFGIFEPDISLSEPEITDAAVCIVPGLAFTENGGRLGYGGGFYDRFFAKNPDICKIALSYEQLIAKKLPLSKHDFTVDLIITEERTVFCNAE